MATNGVPMFTKAEKGTLIQCANFTVALHRLSTQLLADGCTDVTLPPYPRAELIKILNGDTEHKKSKLQGAELDEYLGKQLVCVPFNDPDLQGIVDIARNTPVEDVVIKLKKAYSCATEIRQDCLKLLSFWERA